MAQRDGDSPYRDVGPTAPQLLEYRVRQLERRDREEREEINDLRKQYDLLKDRVLGVESQQEANERNIAKTQRHAEWTFGQWIFIVTTLATSLVTLAATIIAAAAHK